MTHNAVHLTLITMKNIQNIGYSSGWFSLLQDCVLSGLASLMSILLVRWASSPIAGFTALVLMWLGVAVAGTAIGSVLGGNYRVVRRWSSARSAPRLVTCVIIKEVVLGGCLLLKWIDLSSHAMGILSILADTVLTFSILLYFRFVVRIVSGTDARQFKEAAGKRTALVSGTDDRAIGIARELSLSKDFNVVGFISDDEKMAGKVIGDILVYLCKGPADLQELEWRLGGVDCVFLSKGWSNMDHVGQGRETSKMGQAGKVLKRSFDVAMSFILILVFSPLALVCALAIKLDDGGPVLYRQERIGLGGKPFFILKFRSMKTDAESSGARLFSGAGDPRLTRVGAFLRAHHLDELPQLWNVLKGDMSFIGYRPERQVYISQIIRENPRYEYLYQIRPGVTSYATLYNGYTDTLDKMLTRLDLDLYYLRNHSIRFDIRVLGLTFLSIVLGKKF